MDGWPLQLVVVALDGGAVPRGLLDQLHASRSSGVIHLIDGGLLHKGDEGELSMRPAPRIELDAGPYTGRLAGPLFGCGSTGGSNAWRAELNRIATSEQQVFGLSADELAEIADAIPRASDALVLVLEHRWTAGFAETAAVAGGALLAQGCIGPRTVLELGGGFGADKSPALGQELALGPNTSLEE
jgi:hypothetical protein